MTKIRVNIRSVVNHASVREELDVNGRMCIVVPSKTLPDDVVMNEIKYPAAEIAKAFNTLEGTPAPMGHPIVRGNYVGVGHPEAYPFISGAINRNVKRADGVVTLEKWIDKEYATRNHPSLIEAINKKQPIHTSTGLTLERIEVANGAGYKYEAHNMLFDHDAILLNEVGAATPEQGVGVFVNSAGDQYEVVNSVLSDDSADSTRAAIQAALPEDAWLDDYDETTAVYDTENGVKLAQTYTITDGVALLTGEPYNVKRKTVWERVVAAFKPKPVQVENKMDEELKALLTANSDAVAKIAEAVTKLSADVEAVKSAQDAAGEAATVAANAAMADKRKVVAEKLGEVVANALQGEALDAAHAKLQTAATVTAGAVNTSADPLATYER
ncbi:MAG: hypothetical protein RBR22_09985 [Desulfuromonas sp.]|nr:hypothetical protein [Desulfuromonas sp.]